MTVEDDLRGERVGLFSMDPGGMSGITWSNPLLEGSIKEIFERDPITVDEVECYDELEGAKVIAETFQEQMFHWQTELQIPQDKMFFVCEDFIPRFGGNTDRTLLSPVRISGMVRGMLVNVNLNWVWQQPGDALGRWTSDRLRRAGLWTPKMEHGRVATKHAALWVVKATQ